MNRNKRRSLSWALAVIAVLILGLGLSLALTARAQDFPAWAGMHGRGPWAQRSFQDQGPSGQSPDQAPGFGPGRAREFFRDGRGFGPGTMFAGHRPFMALGGLCLLGLVGLAGLVLVGVLFRHGQHHGHPGAIEVLKKEFAEGKISAEEYRGRLAVLKE